MKRRVLKNLINKTDIDAVYVSYFNMRPRIKINLADIISFKSYENDLIYLYFHDTRNTSGGITYRYTPPNLNDSLKHIEQFQKINVDSELLVKLYYQNATLILKNNQCRKIKYYVFIIMFLLCFFL